MHIIKNKWHKLYCFLDCKVKILVKNAYKFNSTNIKQSYQRIFHCKESFKILFQVWINAH